MLRNYKTQLLILAGLVLSGMVLWSMHKPAPLAVVDMQRLLNQPAVLLSQSNLSEQEQKKGVKAVFIVVASDLVSVWGFSSCDPNHRNSDFQWTFRCDG